MIITTPSGLEIFIDTADHTVGIAPNGDITVMPGSAVPAGTTEAGRSTSGMVSAVLPDQRHNAERSRSSNWTILGHQPRQAVLIGAGLLALFFMGYLVSAGTHSRPVQTLPRPTLNVAPRLPSPDAPVLHPAPFPQAQAQAAPSPNAAFGLD
ncbi:hypothetical protein AD947_03890 [Acetobacter tropicalis]|uniref:Uncharacterized protein n=2 Tax=Acetobacter TaxID=434 RepID=A0A149V3D3_9PROT|nr:MULTISPECIES: hypothetical protein [Acetobacter]KXV59514.1 hypothetical protein AD947_03890 [Acetobacter tropicalis]KXV74674.1 hypothetical protein AD953_10635 [Acetobacter malorum]